MTKIITLSLVVAALFFTGCDQKTKKEVSEASSAVSTSVTEKTAQSVDAAKDAVSETADAAKDAMNN